MVAAHDQTTYRTTTRNNINKLGSVRIANGSYSIPYKAGVQTGLGDQNNIIRRHGTHYGYYSCCRRSSKAWRFYLFIPHNIQVFNLALAQSMGHTQLRWVSNPSTVQQSVGHPLWRKLGTNHKEVTTTTVNGWPAI